VKGFLRVAVVLGLVSCSNAGELADGVIEIQVIPPQPSIIDFGDTTRFVAVPLNQEGDSVGAPVVWVTPDDSSLTIIDAATGLVTGTRPNTAGRMQAVLGTLTTGFYPLGIRARADTIVFPDDTVITVASDVSASTPLLPVLQSFNPAGPVVAQNLVFSIVQPAFPDTTGLQSVALGNNLLVQTVLTAADGTPVTGVTVTRVAGRVTPDSVLVSVTATQSSGHAVPGSGQLFLVLFE
jgi:hypothetical protein